MPHASAGNPCVQMYFDSIALYQKSCLPPKLIKFMDQCPLWPFSPSIYPPLYIQTTWLVNVGDISVPCSDSLTLHQHIFCKVPRVPSCFMNMNPVIIRYPYISTVNIHRR